MASLSLYQRQTQRHPAAHTRSIPLSEAATTTNQSSNKSTRKTKQSLIPPQTSAPRGITLDIDHTRSSFGRRAFSVAGPMVWNSLPDFFYLTLRFAKTLLGDL